MRAVPSRNASESRTASSSSITCTRLVIAEILVRYSGHREAEHGAATLVGLHGDLAAVAFDDRARDRQANAHPVALGRDERLEELRRNFGGDAGAGVRYADFDQFSFAWSARDQKLTP